MGSNGKGRTVLEVGADGVALITIINPPVNSLSFDGICFPDQISTLCFWLIRKLCWFFLCPLFLQCCMAWKTAMRRRWGEMMSRQLLLQVSEWVEWAVFGTCCLQGISVLKLIMVCVTGKQVPKGNSLADLILVLSVGSKAGRKVCFAAFMCSEWCSNGLVCVYQVSVVFSQRSRSLVIYLWRLSLTLSKVCNLFHFELFIETKSVRRLHWSTDGFA